MEVKPEPEGGKKPSTWKCPGMFLDEYIIMLCYKAQCHLAMPEGAVLIALFGVNRAEEKVAEVMSKA